MELVTVLVVVALSLGSVWGEVELVCPSPVDTTSSLVRYCLSVLSCTCFVDTSLNYHASYSP